MEVLGLAISSSIIIEVVKVFIELESTFKFIIITLL